MGKLKNLLAGHHRVPGFAPEVLVVPPSEVLAEDRTRDGFDFTTPPHGFCGRCGRRLEKETRTKGGFNRATGKPVREEYRWHCSWDDYQGGHDTYPWRAVLR